MEKLIDKLKDQGYLHKDNFPKAQTKWIYLKPEEIIYRYNAVIAGIQRYYSFVDNRNQIKRIVWALKFSTAFTLSRKWNISPAKVFRKLGHKLKVGKYNQDHKNYKGKERGKEYTTVKERCLSSRGKDIKQTLNHYNEI